MDVRTIVETTAETGEKQTEELLRLSLTDQCNSELGLMFEQGKALLAQLQGSILRHRIEEISAASRLCPCCGRNRPVHDYRNRVLVTVISDGEAALPNLIRGATNGQMRHILDWWHISMRVQHVENAIRASCNG